MEARDRVRLMIVSKKNARRKLIQILITHKLRESERTRIANYIKRLTGEIIDTQEKWEKMK